MSTNGTPGPWFIESHGIMDATRSRTICIFGDSDQDDADLELVASAPRLRDENRAWMSGVADAVEPLGYDREAACGPADLLPGLKVIVEIAELHKPEAGEVEIEFFHETGDPECDDPDPRYDDCNGHTRMIRICGQCGVVADEDGMNVAFAEWPCKTARLLGLEA